MFALSTNKSYTVSLLEDLKKLKEDGQKWRNKRKLENATFLIVPFVQSFITLQTVVLKAAKLKTLALSSVFWLNTNMKKKNLLTFTMLTQKLFLLFTAVAWEKNIGLNI